VNLSRNNFYLRKNEIVRSGKTCPPMFDQLPLDVLHHGILPLLSFDDRISFTRVLNPEDRRCKHLNQTFIFKFSILHASALLRKQITNIIRPPNPTPARCRRVIMRLYKRYENYALAIQYSYGLRHQFLTKLNEFSTSHDVTESFRTSFGNLALKIRQDLVEKYPYIREEKVSRKI